MSLELKTDSSFPTRSPLLQTSPSLTTDCMTKLIITSISNVGHRPTPLRDTGILQHSSNLSTFSELYRDKEYLFFSALSNVSKGPMSLTNCYHIRNQARIPIKNNNLVDLKGAFCHHKRHFQPKSLKTQFPNCIVKGRRYCSIVG